AGARPVSEPRTSGEPVHGRDLTGELDYPALHAQPGVAGPMRPILHAQGFDRTPRVVDDATFRATDGITAHRGVFSDAQAEHFRPSSSPHIGGGTAGQGPSGAPSRQVAREYAGPARVGGPPHAQAGMLTVKIVEPQDRIVPFAQVRQEQQAT